MKGTQYKTDDWDKPICEKCDQIHPRCDGHKRSSDPLRPCMLNPIKGLTVCRMHGGGNKNARRRGRENVARQKAAQYMDTFGLPREVDPHQALLDEVHRTAGHVAWLQQVVNSLDPDSVVWGVTSEVFKNATEYPGLDRETAAVPNVWVELYQKERKHLVAAAKACLDVGIDERRVRLAEGQGAIVARAMTGLIAAMEETFLREGWTVEVLRARAPQLAREQLALAAGSEAEG